MNPRAFLPVLMTSLLFVAVIILDARAAEISLDITSYPGEIMVERGGTVQFDVRVENEGSIDLHNVSIYIENATFPQLRFVPDSVSIFSSKSAQTFHVSLMVPIGAVSGSYPVLLRAHSNELDVEEPVALKVFDLKAELVLYKLQFLRDNLLELEKKIAVAESEGKTAEAPLSESLRNIDTGMSVSENRLYDKRYDDALLAMADVERTLKNASQTLDEIISARTTSRWRTWGYATVTAIFLASAGAIFLFMRHRASRAEAEKLKHAQNSNNLATMSVRSKRAGEVRDEIGALRSALALVESEHEEALVSHESYVELRRDLESRIAKLDLELEKIEWGGAP